MPKWDYEIRAKGANPAEAEILIYGDIGESWDADESMTAKRFAAELADVKATDLTIRINSVGGVVADALGIYNAIKRHPANTTCVIDGVAMSSASLIAMAGDTLAMASNGILMIHAPWGLAVGNAQRLRKTADDLDTYAKAMANAYVRPGLTYDQALALLSDGEDHYYTAQEALDAGLIDSISDAVQVSASARVDLSRYRIPAAAAAHLKLENTMPLKTDPQAAAPTEPATPNVTAIEAAAIQRHAEQIKARNEEIKGAYARLMGRDGVQDLYAAQIADPTVTADQARAALLDHLGKGSEPIAGGSPTRVTSFVDERDKARAAGTAAVLMRVGAEKHDTANPFRGMRLSAMAAHFLDRAGHKVSGMLPEEIAGLALRAHASGQGTSDFPVILEAALHKLVLAGAALAPITYDRFCRIGDVTDLRAWKRLTPGVIGTLDTVNEHGEYRQRALPDAEKESIQVERRGNIIAITPETFINDDLGLIQQQARDIGMAGPRSIERAVYALLESNPTMTDGVALFHANHGNLAGSGAAPSIDTLDAAALAMALQTAPGADAEPLDLRPDIALSHRGKSGLITELVNAKFNDEANKQQQRPNRVLGLVRDVVGSGRLSSTTAWYLFADPNVSPVLEVVFLNGQREARITQQEAFRSGGLEWRIELPFGVGAIGWRGAYKNAGA